MGACCCREDDIPYFSLDRSGNLRRNQNKKKEVLNEIYKKYSKRICTVCKRIKYGRNRDEYGERFVCIDCAIDNNKKKERNKYYVSGRYS